MHGKPDKKITVHVHTVLEVTIAKNWAKVIINIESDHCMVNFARKLLNVLDVINAQ